MSVVAMFLGVCCTNITTKNLHEKNSACKVK